MKKTFFLSVILLNVLCSSCSHPNAAGAKIKEMKASGHGTFALIGKHSNQTLRFANSNSLTITCLNNQFDFESLKPSIDGTGDLFSIEFRGTDPNVSCFISRLSDDYGHEQLGSYILQFFDFVPIQKN